MKQGPPVVRVTDPKVIHEELLYYPVGDHDDTVDALRFASSLMRRRRWWAVLLWRLFSWAEDRLGALRDWAFSKWYWNRR